MGLYTIDSLRRVVMETIVPGLGLWASRKSARKELDQLKVDIAEKPSLRDAVIQAAMPRYEAFDDYLEMVIEFGYITLFASAYPLAACISIAANVIEIKSDSLKLATVYRRPPSEPAGDIGTWEVVLKVCPPPRRCRGCMATRLPSGTVVCFWALHRVYVPIVGMRTSLTEEGRGGGLSPCA